MFELSGRGDVVGTSVYSFLFTLGSGVASVALPLIALSSGLGATEIGVAATASALVQILARAYLGRVMRHVTDRALLVLAGAAQAAAFVAVLAETSLEVITAAWVLQGIGRACFWTCGQTHVVRGTGNAVGVLALFNFIGGVGQFIGPVLAGLVAATDLSLALGLGAVVSALAILPAAVLERHDPFVTPENARTSRLRREPGMSTACWGSVGAGTWRSLMDSFVPVVLEGARYSSTAIGALVSVSNGAAVLGALAVGRIRRAVSPVMYSSTMIATAAGMGAIGLVADAMPAAVVALAVSGFAAGMLQTLSPAIAALSVPPHERGDAIALSGTWRAAAMFAAPLVVTIAAVAVPVGVGLLGVGLALSVPAVTEARRI